jgi:hypothetical protein
MPTSAAPSRPPPPSTNAILFLGLRIRGGIRR